jgi:hypothetical protein
LPRLCSRAERVNPIRVLSGRIGWVGIFEGVTKKFKAGRLRRGVRVPFWNRVSKLEFVHGIILTIAIPAELK